jgi:hypothetical protein
VAIGGIGHHGADRVSRQFSRMGGEASYPPNGYERACSFCERWLRRPLCDGSAAGVLLVRHAFIVTKTSSAPRVRFRTNKSFEMSVDHALSEGPLATAKSTFFKSLTLRDVTSGQAKSSALQRK